MGLVKDDCRVEALPDQKFAPLIIQPSYVEQNAREIAWAVLGHLYGEARTLLHISLNKIQPDPYTWTEGAFGPDLQFDACDGLNEEILRRIMVVDTLPPDWKLDCYWREDCRHRIQRTYATLASIDPQMHRSVVAVLASLLFGRLKQFGGGSNSSAIGCVWLNPKPGWSDIDWLENIFHEYIHQCLFIDDMRHGLFEVDGEVLAREEALVRSALLEKPRPYDRAFHSAFVSFGLMQLDLRIQAAERVAPHIEPLRVTLNQLLEKSRYLTSHGSRVLASLSAAFTTFAAAHHSKITTC